MDSPILTVPVEILLHIFEACDDFPQVIAFASACKHTLTAWVKNSPTIIWSVGRSHIRSFDDALMAVDITSLITDASRLRKLRYEQRPSFLTPTRQGPFPQSLTQSVR
jgi:hypothetical protein